MKKNVDLTPKNSKHYDNELWVEIRKYYESKTHPNYEKIKMKFYSEYKLDKFPSQRTVERHAVKERWVRYEDENTNRIAPNRYSDEFWVCVRQVYESHPKISYKRLKELVQNELKCEDFPSYQALASMAKYKGWKRSDYLLKKSDATLKKLIKSVKNLELKNGYKINLINSKNIKKQYIKLNTREDDTEEFDTIKEIVKCQKVSIEKFLMSSKLRQKSQAEVIMKSRKRVAIFNDLGDLLSDKLILIHTMIMSKEIRRRFTKPMMQNLQEDFRILCNIIDIYNDLFLSIRENTKFELALYGTELEDLKETDNVKQVKDLHDDKAYEEHQLRLIAETERIAARRLYINSGGLEEEISNEMKKRMKEVESDGCDVDDQGE